MDQHSSEKLACQQCGKEFKSKANLKEHERVFHEKKTKFYSKEFKQEALNLFEKLGSKAETARQLNITWNACLLYTSPSPRD